MISIINYLCEKQYEPWMTGTAQQIGGPGYPTAELRANKPLPGVEMAKMKADEVLMKADRVNQISQIRNKKNLTPEQRYQLGVS